MLVLFHSFVIATSIFYLFPSLIPCSCSAFASASITPDYYAAQQSHLQSLLTKWSHSSITLIQPFFQSMPKGGDLHHHITGAVFAETLIDLGASAGLCISPITYQLHDINDCTNNSSLIPLISVYSSSTLYNGIIDAWSMRSWVGPSASSPPNQLQIGSPHDHFFAIFEKMDLATHAMGTVLAKLRSRAASEHVSYLESMIQLPSASTSILNLYHQFTSTCSYAQQDVQQIWYKMLASPIFQNLLQTVASSLTSCHTYSDTILGCNTTSPDPGCQTVSTWIYYIFRDAECDTVVSQSFFAFALASTFPQLVVGIQLVGPEDGYYARQAFTQQMNLIQMMSGLVNNSVNIALHAGELTSAMVPPEDLLTHISSSLHITHAQRVGHMVSILNEPDWQSSLEWMASQKVAVEINLVSNQELLGISGAAHPFPLYLQSSVPCVLSTDDAGIMRTTLTEQFVVAMQRYNLTFATITTLVRNSLEFSFVPGDSLWQKKGDYTAPVSACSTLFTNPSSPSSSCLTYVAQHGTRAALQLRLEQDLFQFGNDMIRTSQKLQRQ